MFALPEETIGPVVVFFVVGDDVRGVIASLLSGNIRCRF